MPDLIKYSAKNLKNLSADFNIILGGEFASCVLDAFHTFLCGSRYRYKG